MIEFEVPNSETPGFLRRQKKLMAFIACPDDSPDKWGLLAEMLMDYVVKPEDPVEAQEAIWDMSENEYTDVLELISNQGEVPKNK